MMRGKSPPLENYLKVISTKLKIEIVLSIHSEELFLAKI